MAQSEIFDQPAVPVQVGSLEVFQQTTPLAYHAQQAATAVVILLVGPEMVGELVDPLRQQRHLHGRTATIGVVQTVLLYDRFFFDRHLGSLLESQLLVGKRARFGMVPSQ